MIAQAGRASPGFELSKNQAGSGIQSAAERSFQMQRKLIRYSVGLAAREPG